MASVSGDTAKEHHVVRLDTFADAHAGELVSADEATGIIVFKDKAGESKTLTFGAHAIKIMRRPWR